MSPFSMTPYLAEGLQKLKDDLKSGARAERNHAILDLPVLDAGYRLITGGVTNIRLSELKAGQIW